MEEGYQVMVDMEPFHNTGPMGALLTAFTQYPGYDVLLIGCDYPFLTAADLYSFLPACKEKASAAFYNANEDIYEPLLAYYQHNSMKELSEAYSKGHYSLQRFLRNTYATKFDPQNKRSMIGVNTKEGFLEASGTINYRKDENFAG